jgi:hypothetical protein
MIEQHLRDWVISDPAIAADIGTRFYPQFAPDGSPVPAVVYSLISDQATLIMTGVAGVRNPRVQLTIVADTQMEVSALAEKLKFRINTWNAAYPDMYVNTCFAEGGVYLSLDYYTPPKNGMIIEAFLNWNPIP